MAKGNRLIGLIGVLALAIAVACWRASTGLAYAPSKAPPEKSYPKIPATAIKFPPRHPVVFYSAAEIEKIKELLKDPKTYQGQQYGGYKAKANQWVDKKIEIDPEGSGNQYYAVGGYCAKCGALLARGEHKRGADGTWTHACLKCKNVHRGEVYDGYWRGKRNHATGRALPWLGLAYAFSGDERYARKAREILLGFAAYYPNWSCGVELTLRETYWFIKVAQGYDLVYDSPCFSAKDHQRIAERFLLIGANKYRKAAGSHGRGTNIGAYNDAVVASIAFCLRNRELAAFAVNRFNSLVINGVDEEGLWWEGLGYHTMTLDALIKIAEAAYRSGIDLYQNPYFRKMLKAPILLTFPDGRLSLSKKLWERLGLHYQLAYLRTRDPEFILGIPPDKMAYGTPVWVTPEWRKEKRGQVSLPSRNFDTFGYAILRSGEGKNRAYLSMTHGNHAVYMGHAPALKFGMILYADGRFWTPFGGGATYQSPLCGAWYRRPIAHNAITVDQFPQTLSKGQVVAFQEAPSVKLVKAVDTGAYPGVKLSRTLALVNGLPVDAFCALSDQEHRYDLSCRFFGEMTANLAFKDRLAPFGYLAGYEYVDNLMNTRTKETWSADWQQEDNARMRLTVLGGEETEVIAGQGPGMTPSAERMPLIIARRWGKATTFLSVMDAYAGSPPIEGITVVSPAGRGRSAVGQATGMRIRSPQTIDYFLVAQQPGTRRYANISFDGEVAVVSHRVGQTTPRVLDLVNGKWLEVAGYSLRCDAPATLYLEELGSAGYLLQTGAESGGELRIEGKFAAHAQITCRGKVVAAPKGRRTCSFQVEPSANYQTTGLAGPVQVTLTTGRKAVRAPAVVEGKPEPKKPAERLEAERQITCMKTSQPPTIDGKVEPDEWAKSYGFELRYTDTGNPNHAVARALWDDRNCYLAIEVKDKDVVSNPKSKPHKPSLVYHGDDVEIYLDSLNLRTPRMGPGCHHLMIGAGAGYSGRTTAASEYAVGVQGTINDGRDTDQGYTIEVAAPWSILGGTPTPSTKVMGFNVTVYNYDSTTVDQFDKCTCLSWAKTSNRPAEEDTTHSPAHWNQLVFEPLEPFKAVEISTRPITGKNRVRNSSFEINGREYNAPEVWQVRTSAHWMQYRPEYAYSNEFAHSGRYSLCLKERAWAAPVTGDGWLDQTEVISRSRRGSYTLSAYVRASKPTKVRLVLYGFDPRWGRDFAGGVSEEFEVDTDWKRISITRIFARSIAWIGVILKREQQFFGGDLYLDDVQLELGAEVTPFALDSWTQQVQKRASKVIRPNLTVNPGFEQGLEDWTVGGKDATKCVTVVTDEKHGGKCSLRMSSEEIAGIQYSASSRPITLIPGARYLLSAWIKMERVRPGANSPGVRLWIYGGGWQFGGRDFYTGTQDWHKIEREFVAKANCSVYVSVHLRNSSGAVWFDDLSLIMIKGPGGSE